MNCEVCQRELAAHDLPDQPARRQAAVEAHLAQCPECRHELAVLRRTAALLASQPLDEPPAGLWQGVEARLAQPTPWRLPRWTYAGAAALVAVLAVAVWPPAEEFRATPYLRDHYRVSLGGPLGDAATGDVLAALAEETQ
ncbi:MAG: hypothetical protein IT204_07605 [Fimbriimonadaceae bacterium]|nr:hypothetical protein [Fimbriimonadaceae bacterium]